MSLLDKWTGRVAGFFDEILLPDELHVTLLRARKAVEQEQHAEAIRLLGEIDARKPGLSRVRELQGVAMIGLGDFPEAARLLQQAAVQRPDPRTFRTLGLALELDRDWRGAREALRRALQLGPKKDELFYIQHGLGRTYLGLKRPDKAIRELRKALRIDLASEEIPLEDKASAQITLARALIKRDALLEARTLLEEGILLSQVHTEHGYTELELDALQLYGQAQLGLGVFEAARIALSDVVKHRPKSEGVLALAGRAALAAGHPHQAKTWLEHVIKSDNNAHHVEILTLLGEALLALDQAAEARLHLSRALRLRSDAPDTLRVSAWATLAGVKPESDTLRRGEIELSSDELQWVHGAEAQFQRLRQLRPKNDSALYGLGRCRMLRGDWSGARRFLASAVRAGASGEAMLDLASASIQADGGAESIAVITDLLAGTLTSDIRSALETMLDRAYTNLTPLFEIPSADNRDIAAWTYGTQQLAAFIARSPKLIGFLPQIRTILNALDAPLDVAFVGEFNAGKSTLVNAFIGEAVVPTGVLPTTAHINVMRFGSRRTAQLHFKDGAVEEVAFPDVRSRVRKDRPNAPNAIAHIEYLYPHPELRRINIWDTPGFNSPNADHEAHATRALAQAEAIFWICDASQALSESEKQRIDSIADPGERLVVVLNKIDQLGPDSEERNAALAEVRRHTEDALGEGGFHGIFAVSGLKGLKARTAEPKDPEAIEDSGIEALLTFAESEVFDRAARLKTSVASRQIAMLTANIQAEGNARVVRIEALSQRVNALREGIDAEERNIADKLTKTERGRLTSGIDFLLTLIAREITESMHPSSRLIDALLTRVELDDEDVEFIIELLTERHASLLARSLERVNNELIEVEQRFVDGIDQLADQLDPDDTRSARNRLEGYLSEARALRQLLDQRVYARYRWIAEGRTTSPNVEQLITRQAASSRDVSEQARKDALQTLLPDIEHHIEADLATWAKEYFDASRRLCDLLQGDLDVLRIEASALTRAFAATYNPKPPILSDK